MKRSDNLCVYVLMCPIENIVRYVGISKEPKRRLQKHIKCEGKNIHKISWIKLLLKKNKKPVMKILHKNLSKNEACKLEIKLISQYRKQHKKKLTNLTDGGEGSWGRVVSEETKIKMRKPKHTKEFKEKLRKLKKGKKLSKKHVENIKKGANPYWKNKKIPKSMIEKRRKTMEENGGFRHTEESRKKMSKSRKGVPKTQDWKKKNSKPVIQIDPETNEIIGEYFGRKEAERQTGILSKYISNACLGIQRTAGGFIWKDK